MQRKNKILCLVAVLWLLIPWAVLYAFLRSYQAQQLDQEVIPEGMQVFVELRQNVRGKKTSDIDRIELFVPWQNEKIVVRRGKAAALMLRGMKEALETKERYGNLSATATVYWKDGSRTRSYGFCHLGDWRHAFSPWFILGVNEAVPADYRIPIARR